jgi:hypothetical protein
MQKFHINQIYYALLCNFNEWMYINLEFWLFLIDFRRNTIMLLTLLYLYVIIQNGFLHSKVVKNFSFSMFFINQIYCLILLYGIIYIKSYWNIPLTHNLRISQCLICELTSIDIISKVYQEYQFQYFDLWVDLNGALNECLYKRHKIILYYACIHIYL